MTIKTLISAAALSCALLAAPAFAQSSATDAKDYAKDKMTEKVENKAKDAVTVKGDTVIHSSDDTVVIKGAPLMIETPNQTLTVKDGKMTAKDENMMVTGSEIKTMTRAPEVTPPAAQIDIACPFGTTAQVDGTCMITGDYREIPSPK